MENLLLKLSLLGLFVVYSECASVNRIANVRVKRVIGGSEVEKGKWPWLVHLTGKVPKTTFWGIAISHRILHCGGSVVDKDWILSAAHCFQNEDLPESEDAGNWQVRFGDVRRKPSVGDKVKHILGSIINKKDWLHSITAEQIFIHPNYTGENKWKHDVALVKLQKSLDLEDKDIGVVSLPYKDEPDFPKDGQNCIMKGWGCTEQGGYVTEMAKQVALPKVKDDECESLYQIDTATRLCAGHNLANKGICKGDSGGPLVCQRKDGVWVQAGIASFTSSVRPEQVPGAFTRVSYYADWIKETVQNN